MTSGEASNDKIRGGPDAALHLAQLDANIPANHQLLAPKPIRSQLLTHLYGLVRRGELDSRTAERRLDYLRGLRLRFLGDRVLQRTAWKIAEWLSWPDTFIAEYVALTELQADAFVCLDPDESRAVSGIVTVASIDDVLGL